MSSLILPALFSSATGGTLWAAVSVIAEKEELSKNHNSHCRRRALTSPTCRRWRWLEWRFEHGLLHLLGVESSVPDPQLCSRQHILGNGQLLLEMSELCGGVNKCLGWDTRTWEVLK